MAVAAVRGDLSPYGLQRAGGDVVSHWRTVSGDGYAGELHRRPREVAKVFRRAAGEAPSG